MFSASQAYTAPLTQHLFATLECQALHTTLLSGFLCSAVAAPSAPGTIDQNPDFSMHLRSALKPGPKLPF